MERKLWFKAKRYGYGWYPSTWEGWVVMAVWAACFVAGEALFISGMRDGANPATLAPLFMAYVVTITGALIWIAAKRGEPARWRWGDDDKK